MDVKKTDLLTLAMLRQQVVSLSASQYVDRSISEFIWSKKFNELGSSTRNYAGYKQWKNFIKRIGKSLALRALLEFIPMVKFYNTFYYEVEVPLALKL